MGCVVTKVTHDPISRRTFLTRSTLGVAGGMLGGLSPNWARATSPGLPPPVTGDQALDLAIGHRRLAVGGRQAHVFTLNGSSPAPLIRLREGRRARLTVTNGLNEDSSIHWHGLLVPFQFDGVPGISFPGIRPKTSFTYDFPIIQSGTYWYHSHSNMQEAMGLYGPLIVDPEGPDPIGYDREHVILLADWSPLHPHDIFRKLKKEPEYFNRQQQTLTSLLSRSDPMPLKDRLEWGRMRMDPTDVSDVTGTTYTYLVNGLGPQENWTGLFRPGERVRLRLINGSAMTHFDIRLPGLRMTVVQADGQDVKPVEVDELQIGVAETYDVIVIPAEDKAYTLVAEAVDRSGMARATLAPRAGMAGPVPPLRKRPTLTMRDMGMDMTGMGDMKMDMSMRNSKNAPQVVLGPGVQTISPMAADRMGEAPQGLANAGHKVLVYTDLEARERNPDTRKPSRSMQIHLTANMDRYMWSFDGKKLSEVTEPIAFRLNERVRVTLVNDTMMSHPIHLHGHFFELVGERPGFGARKHTVLVAPGGTATFDLTASAEGDWAFHCHLLYHMHAGMFQVVSVRPDASAA